MAMTGSRPSILNMSMKIHPSSILGTSLSSGDMFPLMNVGRGSSSKLRLISRSLSWVACTFFKRVKRLSKQIFCHLLQSGCTHHLLQREPWATQPWSWPLDVGTLIPFGHWASLSLNRELFFVLAHYGFKWWDSARPFNLLAHHFGFKGISFVWDSSAHVC